VTFTNKATNEMKNRILEELHQLSRGKGSAMMGYLVQNNQLSESEVSGRAEIILESILQNYSRFHIETIDRFFQRAIRAFTREIGLSGGYQVELDSDRVLSEAIDEMLMDLDREPGLLSWFVDFARDKVLEGKHWNLRRDLLVLGKELSKERFQEGSHDLVSELDDRNKFSGFRGELMQVKSGFEKSLQDAARKALSIMESVGLEVGSFKGQYGVAYFFSRLLEDKFDYPSATVCRAVDNPEEWYAKTSGDIDRIISAYNNGMNRELKRCIDLYKREYRNYQSAESVRGFLYTLGILTDISKRMHSLAESQGVFLLSDAARFLYGIIGENDAPFIYEKIGNYFHHFMIDEFQDTSGLQWKNFKPLIENSLAYDRECLVVGDVKQSIYRWRNSDWEILSEQLPREFNPEQLNLEGLSRNWRSHENIVRFNNAFFSEACRLFYSHFNGEGTEETVHAGKVKRAYADVAQEVPLEKKGLPGYIRISVLQGQEEGHWKDSADQQVIRHIEELQDAGIGPSETAIVVRRKTDGKRIADAILEYKSQHQDSPYVYDVISNESLYLVNSISVRIIVNALRYLLSPDDLVNLAQLVYEYHCFAGKISGPEGRLDDVLKNLRNGNSPGLPDKFMDEALRYLTLNELTERIIALFDLDQQAVHTPYIIGFQDVILSYCKTGPADINSFLNWWDEHGHEKSLAVSEDQDAIQVMTIHKAKGLEFKAVIIPYCNWNFDHRSPHPEILWCNPTQAPFNKLSLLPVRYSAALRETIFEDDYAEEKFRIYMDHLNLLYVAFTRARESLAVFTPEGKDEGFADVSTLIKRILKEKDFIPDGKWEEEGLSWRLGDLSFTGASMVKRNQLLVRQLSSHEFSGKLRLMYRGTDFFDQGTEEKVQHGILMHEIFSRIKTAGDIDTALDSVRREGMIDAEKSRLLRPEVKRYLEMDLVKDWFDGTWKVIAEQDILTREGSLRRPDRVMLRSSTAIVVDYKFGMVKSSGHLVQVRKYAGMLKQMKYEELSGFVWYVYLNEVVKVL
jgi:superfamily I DNA/RNA helicase